MLLVSHSHARRRFGRSRSPPATCRCSIRSPERALCPETPMSLAQQDGQAAAAGASRSTKLPPAQTFMAVDRRIDNCPAPLTHERLPERIAANVQIQPKGGIRHVTHPHASVLRSSAMRSSSRPSCI